MEMETENQLQFGVKSLVIGNQKQDSGNSEVTTNFGSKRRTHRE